MHQLHPPVQLPRLLAPIKGAGDYLYNILLWIGIILIFPLRSHHYFHSKVFLVIGAEKQNNYI